MASTPALRISSAVLAVIPAPPAAFSPLAKIKSAFKRFPNSVQIAYLRKVTTRSAHHVTQNKNPHLVSGGLLVIAKQAIMNQEYDIVPPITVQIENITLAWFESAAFFSLIVEIFLKDLEVQERSSIVFFVRQRQGIPRSAFFRQCREDRVFHRD